MRLIFNILAAVTGFYSLLIFIRIIFSWFTGLVSGKPVELIGKITDPYIDWWRSKIPVRIGYMDFSIVAGIMFLYLLQNIFTRIASSQIVSAGVILAMILLSLWSVITFIGWFCIIIIILRIIAYLTNRNIYSQFWSAIDSISKPVIYQINRMIFGSKIVNYLTGMIVPAVLIAALMFAGGFLINLLSGILYRLPI